MQLQQCRILFHFGKRILFPEKVRDTNKQGKSTFMVMGCIAARITEGRMERAARATDADENFIIFLIELSN
jgi:hypothetical protein